MALHLDNLDDVTRQYMVSEATSDINGSSLYLSPRLSPKGMSEYPQLLLDAIESGNDETMAAAIAAPGRLNSCDTRLGKPIKMNVNAPSILAEGEFNRFYIRGLCLRAIAENRQVIAYRARFSSVPRSSSLAVDGVSFDPSIILEDLRDHSGTEPEHGFPGPNSGMSIRLA
jgi:hypothetical protein